MSNRNRLGFTLVELLVVMGIIGMLVALLVPAIQGAIGASRLKQCGSNQRNIALAVEQYVVGKHHFPGFVNPRDHSWVVVILKGLEEENLHKRWLLGEGPKPFIKMLWCPADNVADVSEGKAALSYVVNCGEPGNDKAPKHTGIFHDRSGTQAPIPTVIPEDIIDGAQHTLLISEYLRENREWPNNSEALVGFTWNSTGNADDMSISDHINSMHSGGVEVTYCDYSQKFLNENIEYEVYKYLMTPYGFEIGQTEPLDEWSLDAP